MVEDKNRERFGSVDQTAACVPLRINDDLSTQVAPNKWRI